MQPSAFLDSIREMPSASHEAAVAPENGYPLEALLAALSAYSPYLSRLVTQQEAWFADILHLGVDTAHSQWRAALPVDLWRMDTATVMCELRLAKSRMALLVSLADITGQWPLETVTGALCEVAEWALQTCCDHLLWQGHVRGEIVLPHTEAPTRESGLIVLGMGKLGAGELNYSSDVDLILLYERQALTYIGRHDIQRFYSRLALELSRMMQERTAEGYVFRTDLRLRPDPASTPPAMSTAGALTYYETVGQNWERAAMIKARPVAGDLAAGGSFLKELRPFIWRKYLDYPAIDDILSIKRQMHAKAGEQMELPGHNVKTGTGGIREIEFFAQVHQLIWGGRIESLRSRPTCETLARMVEADLLDAATRDRLIESYAFLRRVEHRLQMVADEQTHKLPSDVEAFARLSGFCGYDKVAEFEHALRECMDFVHRNFAEAFSEKSQLSSGQGGSLVFTGVDADEATLASIGALGFRDTIRVWESIAAWHRGSRRATRTKRARELITEITPALLAAIGGTAEPDQAFRRLDEFVGRLPSGVQLFSLLAAQPQLITLLATILGGAPAMAAALSQQPSLFDVLLSGDVYARTADKGADWLQAMLSHARTPDEHWQQLVRYRQEQEFYLGMQVLRRTIDPLEALPKLSEVAERCLRELVDLVTAEFERDYGRIEGGRFAVLAMGRLGAREVCFGSDLDLVFVYDAPDMEAKSDGARGFDARVYYNRLSQRIVGLLEAPSAQGRLYTVDTRLRPSGKDGHLAVSLDGFCQYFRHSAWSFERMALSRGRSVAGDVGLCTVLDSAVVDLLRTKLDWPNLCRDILDLRGRIAAEHTAKSVWDVKYAEGGLLEIDFLLQGLALAHATNALPRATIGLLPALRDAGLLDDTQCLHLRESYVFQLKALNLLRLCQPDPRQVPSESVQRLVAEILGLPSAASLATLLAEAGRSAHQSFAALLK